MDYKFKHFLNFKSLPEVGRLEISEPFGFDGQTHSVSQDEGRFGRDVVIANENITLKIHRDFFNFTWDSQVLINGNSTEHLTHGFDYISFLFKNNGWESEVEYIINKEGVDWVVGIIDFFTCDMKEDEITFSVIQNTKREVFKRRGDVYIDAFSNKDLDGNYIEPCKTSRVLLKAKSIQTESSFSVPESFGIAVLASKTHFFNPAQQISKYEVNDTLDWLDPVVAVDSNLPNVNANANFFGIVRAKEDLSDVEVSISNMDYRFLFPVGAQKRRVQQQLILSWGYLAENPIGSVVFFDVYFDENTPPTDYFNSNDYSHIIPLVPSGAKIFLYFRIGVDANFSSQHVLIPSLDVSVKTKETGIDSVINGVRLIDLIKHNVKSIASGLNVNAPIYDIDGEHYNNFTFNGYLMSNGIKRPFVNKFNELINVTKEICADYQVNYNSIDILRYPSFYTDKEIAIFDEKPNADNSVVFQKKYFIKTVEFGYNKSSSKGSNNEKGSSQDVHTNSQFLLPSKKTDGDYKISIKHIRSSYLIEQQRQKTFDEKETKQHDESLFIIDVIPYSGGVEKQFTRILRVFKGIIYSNGSFYWDMLGISVGDIISVNNTPVKILSLTDKTMNTNGDFGVGNLILTIKYTLTSVDFISRSNEGFTSVIGVDNPENYANLKYHISRNLNEYKEYLSTAGTFLPDGVKIKHTHTEVNGDLSTTMAGELFPVSDFDDIEISTEKIVTPFIYSFNVFCDFEKATNFFKDIQKEKGYITINTLEGKKIKGYPKKAEYTWATNELSLELEEKAELKFMEINRISSGVVSINNNIYLGANKLESFEINNNFVSLFEKNGVLIESATYFKNIKIQGAIYSDIVAFSNALNLVMI